MGAWISESGRLSRWWGKSRGQSQPASPVIGLAPFLGLVRFIRVLTDSLSPSNSRHSGSLNLSGSIAVLLIVVAVGILLARRQATRPTLIAALWLCVSM